MDGAASPFRTPVVALDGPDKVTGAARYTFDVSVPGMLHAKVLRSPYPHAGILSIDTMRAEALPGVVAAVTGADAARLPDPYYGVAIRDQPVVAINKVRYVGDMVAAVAAIDEETAYRALALIDVQYEKLPAVMTIEAALAEGAPVLFDTPVAGEPIKLGGGLISLKEPRPKCALRVRLHTWRRGRRVGAVRPRLRRLLPLFTDQPLPSRAARQYRARHGRAHRVVVMQSGPVCAAQRHCADLRAACQ
jgi:CO/xanthine dehydrogenase Mo-binding subunit